GCPLNSTEKPWNGLACSPARNPSTMKRARRSSRPTWRMTSGLRYFSVVLMGSLYHGAPRRKMKQIEEPVLRVWQEFREGLQPWMKRHAPGCAREGYRRRKSERGFTRGYH